MKMTSTDFLEKIYSILNDQNHRISFSPAQKNNWLMECNGNFIGGLFDEELCFVHTDAASEILNNPEPIFRGYSKNSEHKMLAVPIEISKQVLHATYEEKFDWKTSILDITYIIEADCKYPDHMVKNYDLFVIFLHFCYEKGLLRLNPMDKQNRIIRMEYINNSLTEKGKKIFPDLLHKWLTYTDRTGKIDNIKMLEKYYSNIHQEQSN
jgi:hypothetical protein